MRDTLLYFALKYEGNFLKIYEAIYNKEQVNFDLYEQLKNKQTRNYITIIDDNYPDMFKTIDSPPFVLFYEGNINLIQDEFLTRSIITDKKSRIYIDYDLKKSANGIELDSVIACENIDQLEKILSSTKGKLMLFENTNLDLLDDIDKTDEGSDLDLDY